MGEAGIVFDHVHLISADPQAAASWYMDRLGGKIVGQSDMGGARQFLVAFDGATLIVRGQREREQASTKSSLHWGTDHFEFRVKEGGSSSHWTRWTSPRASESRSSQVPTT